MRFYLPPGNVGLDQPQHLQGSLVETDEDSIVDLSQAEQLKDLTDTGAHTVDSKRLTESYKVELFNVMNQYSSISY